MKTVVTDRTRTVSGGRQAHEPGAGAATGALALALAGFEGTTTTSTFEQTKKEEEHLSIPELEIPFTCLPQKRGREGSIAGVSSTALRVRPPSWGTAKP